MSEQPNRRRRLSDYLDSTTTQEDTPDDSDEITEKITENFSPEIVSKIKLNPKIGPLFYECLGKIQAVKDGMRERPNDRSGSVEGTTDVGGKPNAGGAGRKFQGRSWTELARFIPLRLSPEERRILAILDRTL
jgi:hypothetical protein